MGVPRLTREWTIVEPPKIDCSATGFPSSPGVRSTASVSSAGVHLDREPGGDLLALGRARQQDERRGLLLDQLGEQRRRRRDDVVVEGRASAAT